MPTKNEIKRIQSLKQKKKRQQEHVFVAEGEKLVRHLIQFGAKAEKLFALESVEMAGAEIVSAAEMKQLSLLKTPSSALGIFEQPDFKTTPFQGDLVLVLDAIRDPGNLGTMLRLCDWFGVGQIVCTSDCVDVYNEKVVQASMGSVISVACFYLDREAIIDQAMAAGYILTSTSMDGESVYEKGIPAKTALIIGNEGQGISKELLSASQSLIAIPSASETTAESLNAAMATSVFLSEYLRTRS